MCGILDVADPHGGYNLCHFWSNFEIADLRFFRSQAYQHFFDSLDRCAMPCFFLQRHHSPMKVYSELKNASKT